MLGDILEDSFDFRSWTESLDIKRVDSTHNIQDALMMLVTLNLQDNHIDGVEYNNTVKPKCIDIKGQPYVQVTLRQGPDLVRGLYFPIGIEDIQFSYSFAEHPPGKWRTLMEMTPEIKETQRKTGYVSFPVALPRLTLQKVKLAVRLNSAQLRPEYWPNFGFTLVEVILDIKHYKHLNEAVAENVIGLFSQPGWTTLEVVKLNEMPIQRILPNGERSEVPRGNRWLLVDCQRTTFEKAKRFAQAVLDNQIKLKKI